MGMLDRIKKRHFAGFKEFVLNMETSGVQTRQQIFMTGIIEDPLFMAYVMKNIRSFEDFLELPSEEIDKVLGHQEQMLSVFAKCLHGLPAEKLMALESVVPKYFSKLKDELSYLKEVTPAEREGAKYFVLKVVRKLQMSETINGFRWDLPTQDLFQPKVHKDGPQKIYFESGVLAAEGDIIKAKRNGYWKHFYDSGKLLAEGEYLDGLKHGSWTFYFGNGNLKSQGKYRADLKQGFWKEWDRSGLLSETEFHEGVKKD